MSRRTSIVCAAVSALAASSLGAQRLRGVVRDGANNGAVGGAVVLAIDSAGATITRTIADAAGAFSFARELRLARLHVVRIGYRPRDVDIRQPTDTTVEITMDRIPPLLAAMRVTGAAVCPGSNEGGEALALWEQARDGLLAAVVAREANAARARTVRYDRRLTVADEVVREQRVRVTEGTTRRPFVAAAGPSYFAKVGFMSEDSDGSRVFNAPDADILLDPMFAATHCFRARLADATHPGQVGLAFAPVPSRNDLVDVDGVIWIDATAPQLRTVDFRYTSLERAAMNARAGGHLEFQTVSNGQSFIQQWFLRLPVLAAAPARNAYRLDQRTPVSRQDREDVRVAEIVESGGSVPTATWADGVTWRSPATMIEGVVTRRNTGVPVSHVTLSLLGATDSATTDSAGHFRLEVIPGKYTIVANDPLLSEYAAEHAERTERATVVAQRDQTTPLRVEIEGVADGIGRICRGQTVRDDRSIMLGQIVTQHGSRTADMRVVGAWQDDYNISAVTGVGVHDSKVDVPVNDGGRFVICGVARGRPIHLRLVLGSGDGIADTTTSVRDSTPTHSFTWRVSADVGTDAAVVSGTVTGPDLRPVPYAQVGIPELQRVAITDTAGRFRLSAVQPGRYVLQVRRIGYAPLSDTLTLISSARAVRALTLRQVVRLDTVRTTAAQPLSMSPGLRGFDDRRHAGQGSFVGDSTLREHEQQPLSSVLSLLVPELRIVREGMSSVVATSRIGMGGKNPLVGVSGGKVCYSTVYIDGVLIYDIDADGNEKTSPPDINSFAVRDLSGLEYHGAATTPPQFKAGVCGTLLLWTRDR